MRNFSTITEAEVKAVYDTTPEVNQYHSWEAVKACEPMYLALKNKLIAHQQEQHMEKPQSTDRIFIGIDKAKHAPAKVTRRSTITLNETQIKQITTAVRMARNYLQCGGLNEAFKAEALQELADSQKTLASFYTPKR